MKYFVFFFSLCISCNASWRIIDENRYPPDKDYVYEMRYEAVDCANNNDCIAIGNMMLKMPWNRVTHDGGKNWETTLADSILRHFPIRIYDVSYPDTNLCIIVGDSNYFWRSTDRCKTWVKGNFGGLFESDQIKSYNIKMFNSKFGGIVTPWELFLTHDGGLNWNNTKIQLDDSVKPIVYYDLSIPNDSTIILLGSKKFRGTYLIKSTDLGNHWVAYDSTPKPINQLSFINSLEGWGCGGQQIAFGSPNFKNIITHTKDGGKTWELQLDSMPYKRYGLFRIKFADNLNGYALGVAFNTWKTSNGGKIWNLDTSYSYPNMSVGLRNFYLFKNKEIMGVTDDAFIYKYENETPVEDNVKQQNDSQIFPNPASDFIEITDINPMLKHGVDYSSIRIYNIFGQTVLSVGTIHELPLRIDVSTLPPGMYFVRIGDRVSKFVKL